MTNEMKTDQGHTMALGDEPRSGKTAAHVKLLAEMAKGGNGHTLVFGPRRTGMSGQYDVFRLTQAEVNQMSGKAK